MRKFFEVRGISCKEVTLDTGLHAVFCAPANDSQNSAFTPQIARHGDTTLLGDLSLYNRTELEDWLVQKGHDVSVLSDMQTAVSYLGEKGPDAVADFIADFSLVSWNARSRELSFVRDHLGMCPLAWTENSNHLSVSNSSGALHAIDDVSPALNVRSLARHLVVSCPRRGESYHMDVNVAEPSVHYSYNENSGVKKHPYWQPRIPVSMDMLDPEQAFEAVMEELKRALSSRISGDLSFGFRLSGGLDSSLVTSMAGRMNPARSFPAYAACLPEGYDPRKRDERKYAEAVVSGYDNLNLSIVDLRENELSSGVEESHKWLRRPSQRPLQFVRKSIQQHAARDGVDVLLSGTGGDDHVSVHGSASLKECLLSLRVGAAIDEARRLEEGSGLPAAYIFARQLLGIFQPSWVRENRLKRHDQWLTRMVLKKKAAEQFNIFHDIQGFGSNAEIKVPLTVQQEMLRNVNATCAREYHTKDYDCLYETGVDARAPLLDRRLIETVLRVPSECHVLDGKNRALARRALRKLVPPLVFERSGKGSLSLNYFEKLKAEKDIFEHQMLQAKKHELWDLLIDEQKLFDLNKIPDKEVSGYFMKVYRTLLLPYQIAAFLSFESQN